MYHRRLASRTALFAALTAVMLSACGGTGSAASTPPSAASTPTAGPSESTAFASTAFDRPFTLTLPAGWVVGEQSADMSSMFLPMGPNQGPRLGLDIQEVSKVFKDPCDPQSSDIDPGPSAADLAKWMGSWVPLHSTGPVAATLSGFAALTVDEAFTGTPCANANLWPTSGGYLDPPEHKRYFILEVRGTRVVVTLVGRDDTWDATLADGLAVLDGLQFATK